MNVHGDALYFVVTTWARHKTAEASLNNGWRLAVGGWWRLAVGGGWWRLAVGGPGGLSLRAVLNKRKGVPKDSPGRRLSHNRRRLSVNHRRVTEPRHRQSQVVLSGRKKGRIAFVKDSLGPGAASQGDRALVRVVQGRHRSWRGGGVAGCQRRRGRGIADGQPRAAC